MNVQQLQPASLADLVAVARRHAEAEGAGDLVATMATLEGEPVYDLWPIGRRFSGMDAVERYYRYFFAEAAPRIRGFTLHAEWEGAEGLAQDYSIDVDLDGELRRFRVFGVLTFGRERMSGERLYADEAFLRFLLGPIWDETQDISSL